MIINTKCGLSALIALFAGYHLHDFCRGVVVSTHDSPERESGEANEQRLGGLVVLKA